LEETLKRNHDLQIALQSAENENSELRSRVAVQDSDLTHTKNELDASRKIESETSSRVFDLERRLSDTRDSITALQNQCHSLESELQEERSLRLAIEANKAKIEVSFRTLLASNSELVSRIQSRGSQGAAPQTRKKTSKKSRKQEGVRQSSDVALKNQEISLPSVGTSERLGVPFVVGMSPSSSYNVGMTAQESIGSGAFSTTSPCVSGPISQFHRSVLGKDGARDVSALISDTVGTTVEAASISQLPQPTLPPSPQVPAPPRALSSSRGKIYPENYVSAARPTSTRSRSRSRTCTRTDATARHPRSSSSCQTCTHSRAHKYTACLSESTASLNATFEKIIERVEQERELLNRKYQQLLAESSEIASMVHPARATKELGELGAEIDSKTQQLRELKKYHKMMVSRAGPVLADVAGVDKRVKVLKLLHELREVSRRG